MIVFTEQFFGDIRTGRINVAKLTAQELTQILRDGLKEALNQSNTRDFGEILKDKGFKQCQEHPDVHTGSYSFWTPVIALFTGARLNEICQLYVDDIRQEEDVWTFDFNENASDKHLKTKAGKRLVPLHPVLVNDLKLPEYAQKLREQGRERLFPELALRREGYGTTVSKWFARYKKRCGVEGTEKKKDFHSFRHLFANELKQIGVEPAILAELLGHEVPMISMSRYGKVDRVHKLDGAGMMIEKAAIEVLKPGNEGMQHTLMEMLECFQDVCAKVRG